MIALLTLIALLKPTVGVPFLVVVAFERLVVAARDPAPQLRRDFPTMAGTIVLWAVANRLAHGGPWLEAWAGGIEHYPSALRMGAYGAAIWAQILVSMIFTARGRR